MSEVAITRGAELGERLEELLAAVELADELARKLSPLLPALRSRRRGDVSLVRFELARARIWANRALEEDNDR